MEKITRVLEHPHSQRFERSELKLERADAKIAVFGNQAPSAESHVELTETVMLKTPVATLDERVRENERILEPGAGGEVGQAYKMLRTQVLRRLDQLGANTLGVMSPGNGEGKTLTAINLAIAIAADPARSALLVDVDLRNPSVARRFRHQPDVGLEDCLEQHRPAREAMFKVAGYGRLTIAGARARCEHSSELLSSAYAGELVAEMRSRYANRIVIFDLPPVLHADDALAFSRHLQAGLLVIGERRTRREGVMRTLQLLGELTFVGTVLNASREPMTTYY